MVVVVFVGVSAELVLAVVEVVVDTHAAHI